MMQSGRRLRRLAALLLLGASTTAFAAPVLDAIEFHRGTTAAAGLHFDKRGGCESHSERCVLRGPDTGLRFIGAAVRRDTWVLRTRRTALRLETASAVFRPATLNQSRAPPVTLV